MGGEGESRVLSSLVWPRKAKAQKGPEVDGSGEGAKLTYCLPLSEGVGDGGLVAITVVVESGTGRQTRVADDVSWVASRDPNEFQRTPCTTSFTSSGVMTYFLVAVSVGASTQPRTSVIRQVNVRFSLYCALMIGHHDPSQRTFHRRQVTTYTPARFEPTCKIHWKRILN